MLKLSIVVIAITHVVPGSKARPSHQNKTNFVLCINVLANSHNVKQRNLKWSKLLALISLRSSFQPEHGAKFFEQGVSLTSVRRPEIHETYCSQYNSVAQAIKVLAELLTKIAVSLRWTLDLFSFLGANHLLRCRSRIWQRLEQSRNFRIQLLNILHFGCGIQNRIHTDCGSPQKLQPPADLSETLVLC